MMRFTWPTRAAGTALAIIAIALIFGPASVQAQGAPDDDSTHASPGNPDRPNADDDTLDNGDDDLPPAEPEDRSDEARVDDGQAFARSDEENRCIAEFRSFDPSSGTIESDTGERLRCPYLD